MNSNRNVIFAFVALAGAAFALWTGMPAFYLLFLACPLMMLFMMASMSRGTGHGSPGASTRDEAGPADARSGSRTP